MLLEVKIYLYLVLLKNKILFYNLYNTLILMIHNNTFYNLYIFGVEKAFFG